MLNLSVILEDSARRYPLHPAFTFAGTTYTYEQINEEANRVANGLVAIGIRPGEKVAMCSANIPWFPIIYFGILKAGAVVVPLNVLFKKEEFIYHLKDSDAKAFLCFYGTDDLPIGRRGWEAFNTISGCEHFFMIMSGAVAPDLSGNPNTIGDLIRGQSEVFNTVETNPEDTAIIIYTSGTTGFARGAELTHFNLFTNAIVSTGVLQSVQQDVQLIVLPLFHIFGMTVLMNAGIYKGLHSILMPRFDTAAVFGLIEKYAISILTAVPTMYWALLNHTAEDFDDQVIANNLRICVSGGASLPVKVLMDFEKRFDVPILEGYGMSEGSPVVTFNQLNTGRRPGSIGKPVWAVEVKVVNADGGEAAVGEKGELLYRGPNVMKGYYNNPLATADALQNGWLHSGDIAIKDEDGFFFIVDRIKDMIIRGGYNVYPREIEEIMLQHEGVSMAAVVGVPDEKLGEEIKAFVVLKKGIKATEDEIVHWTKERMASYKYPRLINFVEALPLSASGKILKKDLRRNETDLGDIGH